MVRQSVLEPPLNSKHHIEHLNNYVICPDTVSFLDCHQLICGKEGSLWIQANINEIGRLANRFIGNRITPTKTLQFIPDNQLPAGRPATYLCIVASF